MSFRTHITIADRGWILEKLAREIAVRSNSVSSGTEPDPSADLHYYINYSCRHRRAGPVEIAFFTHSENDPNARKRYFDIAADVEHSVCMSRRYAEELTEAGIKDVTTITPGSISMRSRRRCGSASSGGPIIPAARARRWWPT